MGESICKWSNRQRINLQNIQAARAAQYQKNKQPNPKMGRKPKLIEIDKKSDEKFRQGFIGARAAAAHGGENKKQVPLLTSQGEGELVP